MRVKDKDTFGAKVIGATTLRIADLLAKDDQKLRLQLVNEESFQPAGFVECIPHWDAYQSKATQ